MEWFSCFQNNKNSSMRETTKNVGKNVGCSEGPLVSFIFGWQTDITPAGLGVGLLFFCIYL